MTTNNDFFSSFEVNDRQPLEHTVEMNRFGAPMTFGISCGLPQNGMRCNVTNGPNNLYAAKSGVGWTGLRALTVEGAITVDGEAFAYNSIYEVDIPVRQQTELSYFVAPAFTDFDQIEYTSTYISVDLAFDDGSYLHELEAIDQHGIRLTPQAQGNSKTLYNNQWNFKRSNIGTVAAGKVIKRILVAYHHPEADAGTAFRAVFDDLKIESQPTARIYSRLSDYVNILRGTHSNGTFSRGNCIAAVAVPNGFNFWIPRTDAVSDWTYAYHEHNNEENLTTLQAFAMSHEPSPWIGDRQTLQFMPSAVSGKPSADPADRQLAFKHSNETARPYYYSVKFENGIRTEFAPTDHAAIFRFTFAGEHSSLIFDIQGDEGKIDFNGDGALQGYTDYKSPNGSARSATRMFFYVVFNRPILSLDTPVKAAGKKDCTARCYRFDTTSERTVEMRIASSMISVEQAKHNLQLEIPEEETFETVRESAQRQWDARLGKVEVEGASEDQLVTLYSNLYRLFLYPNSAYENVGTREVPIYKHPRQAQVAGCENSTDTDTCADILDGKAYVNHGFWDTYRTAWPAYSLLASHTAGELIGGFVQQYKDGGWISRWSAPGYVNSMVGTSANVAFADAYLKGIENFDVKSFYQAALKDATVQPPNDYVGRKGMATSVFNGYTSYEGQDEALSWALEGYINDFGIANLARALAERNDSTDPYNERYREDFIYFMNRSLNYVRMFNQQLGFFNGRSSSGEWRDSPEYFNPTVWGGHSGDYTETNAWNMAFHTPHDGQGLANLYGGREALAFKLDTFFELPELAKEVGTYGQIIHEMTEARDIRMGQYGHSNQPSHHIIYMYNYAGQPWKTQEKVREVLERLYIGSEIGQGYPGDEDNGEMSAWYILSALGFYPLRMGSPEYAIGAPLFKKATLHLDNGKTVIINAPNNSRTNKYVQRLSVNGVDYNHTYLMHSKLAEGATLDFEMGSEPTAWGTNADSVPISITSGLMVPSPLKDKTDQMISRGLLEVSDNEGNESTQLAVLFENNAESEMAFKSATPKIQIRFVAGKEHVRLYTLTSGRNSEANDPRSWRVTASNNGLDWTLLDERDNEVFPWRQQTRPFVISGHANYSLYCLEVTSVNGGEVAKVSEIEFMG